MKLGILGSGDVAQALGAGLVRHGHDVVLGTRDPAKLAEWAADHGARVATVPDAAAHGEIVLLAVRARRPSRSWAPLAWPTLRASR